MNGIAYRYPWKYRAFDDELVLMTPSQVFKLRVYHEIGRRHSRDEIQSIAESLVTRDIAELRLEESRQTGA